MRKRSKKYTEAIAKFDKNNVYTKEEAVKLVKETSTSSFDGTVEIAMRLNLDTKKADQQLRGAIALPKGTGKTKKVLVIARGRLGIPGSGSFMVFMDSKSRILTAASSPSHVIHKQSLEETVYKETLEALKKVGFECDDEF